MKKIISLLVLSIVFTNPMFAKLIPEKITSQPKSIEFIQNVGQYKYRDGTKAHDILFRASHQGKQIYVRNTGLSFVYTDIIYGKKPGKDELLNKLPQNEPDSLTAQIKQHRTDMEFVGANIPSVVGVDKSEAYINYYIPDCIETNVPIFNKIEYKRFMMVLALYYMKLKIKNLNMISLSNQMLILIKSD